MWVKARWLMAGSCNVLKWTVFKAATSQPRDCMTNVAIVFPTWLQMDVSNSLCQLISTRYDDLCYQKIWTHTHKLPAGVSVWGFVDFGTRDFHLHDWRQPEPVFLVLINPLYRQLNWIEFKESIQHDMYVCYDSVWGRGMICRNSSYLIGCENRVIRPHVDVNVGIEKNPMLSLDAKLFMHDI